MAATGCAIKAHFSELFTCKCCGGLKRKAEMNCDYCKGWASRVFKRLSPPDWTNAEISSR